MLKIQAGIPLGKKFYTVKSQTSGEDAVFGIFAYPVLYPFFFSGLRVRI
jgi:hypothetical protein